ncbi:CCL13 protein, partial [Pardalotus punctatus]|nr:CCL13 protein [Pardalotus punctatus]
MKVLAATLAALLLLATCSPAEAGLSQGRALSPALADGVPSTCCFTYRRQRIPASRVSSVFVTSSSCTHPAVIVVTTKGKQLCADPQAAWVQELLRHFRSLEN